MITSCFFRIRADATVPRRTEPVRRPNPSSSKCTSPLLARPAEVVVGLVAAELQLRWKMPSGTLSRLPEMNSQARAGPSRSWPRHGWQRKISSPSVTPSLHTGASKAVRGVKRRVYVEDKGEACVEGGNSLKTDVDHLPEPWIL